MCHEKHAFYHVKLVREGRATYSQPITAPVDAVAFFHKKLATCVQESFVCLYMNARNAPLGWREVSRGSVSASIVHPREVFLPAISLVASSIIMAHNHPSGDATPSKDDVDLTRRLMSAGQLLGIEILDHIVVTANGHLSLKEHGFL